MPVGLCGAFTTISRVPGAAPHRIGVESIAQSSSAWSSMVVTSAPALSATAYSDW